jgi:hypothetical protein
MINLDDYRLLLMDNADLMRSKLGCEGHREIITACGRATTESDLDSVLDNLMESAIYTRGPGMDRLAADLGL